MTDYEHKARQVRQTITNKLGHLPDQVTNAVHRAQAYLAGDSEDHNQQPVGMTDRERVLYEALGTTALNLRHQASSYRALGSNLIADQLFVHANRLDDALNQFREWQSGG